MCAPHYSSGWRVSGAWYEDLSVVIIYSLTTLLACSGFFDAQRSALSFLRHQLLCGR